MVGSDDDSAMTRSFIRECYTRMKQNSRGFTSRHWQNRNKNSSGDSTYPDVQDSDATSDATVGWVSPPGIARSLNGTGKSVRDPKPLQAVLSVTTARQKWKVPLSVGFLSDAWPQIVGEAVAQHSAIESLNNGRLFVRADSTAWANQLQLLVPQMEKRIDDVVGHGKVTQVIVHGPARPSWKHGPRSVPGRGPRDTYG